MKQLITLKKKQFILLIIIIVLGRFSLITALKFNASALDMLIKMDFYAFLKEEVYLLSAWGFVIFFDWLSKNYKEYYIQNIHIALRHDISNKLTQVSYQEFHSRSVNTYLSWLNNDMKTITTQALLPLFDIISGTTGCLFAIVALYYYHWSLVFASFIALLFMLTIPKIFDKRMKEQTLATTVAQEHFLGQSEDLLKGFHLFFGLRLLHQLPQKMLHFSKELKDVIMKQAKLEALIATLGFGSSIIAQIGVTILTGYLAVVGLVSIGTMEAMGGLTGIIFDALGNLGSQIAKIRSVEPILNKFSHIHCSAIASISTLTPQTEELFSANHLGYVYQNQRPIFNALQFTLHKGGKYAIVGESGSGKSTLFKVLAGLYTDYTGSLTYQGVEMTQLDVNVLFDKLFFLEQNPHFFNDTLLNNVALDENYTTQEVLNALEKAGFASEQLTSEFIHKIIGENGCLLSGGQRQKVALARALLRQKEIILIDEGTSAIDKETSLAIEYYLLQQPHLTIIMITHHLHHELLPLFNAVYHFPTAFQSQKN